MLETLLNQGQHAWVPYISTWSIKTLGFLSDKYKRSDNRGESNGEIWINTRKKLILILKIYNVQSKYLSCLTDVSLYSLDLKGDYCHIVHTISYSVPFDK